VEDCVGDIGPFICSNLSFAHHDSQEVMIWV